MFKLIVHPTDLSEASIPALKSAHELAKKLGSKLLVCFVARSPMVAQGDSLTDPETNETRDIAAELESYQARDSEVEMELKIIVADKSTRVKTLLSFLEGMDCDLLVLGMHKRAGIAGWLGHSITEEVVRRAGCTVMVVKQLGSEWDLGNLESVSESIDEESGV